MRINEKALKTVAFIGMKTPHSFVPHGTGFFAKTFVNEKTGFQTIVTAKHVIEGINSKEIFIRINDKNGQAKFLSSLKSDWIAHPDSNIDVSVCPSVVGYDEYDILSIPVCNTGGQLVLTEDIIKKYDIGCGDEVFIPGMYSPRIGEAKNIPIFRMGNVASMPEEPLQTKYGYHNAYLIEARSLDGLSGSPVFVHRFPLAFKDGNVKFQQGNMFYLMGLVLGYYEVTNPSGFISVKQKEGGNNSEDNKVYIPQNTGVAIVLPIIHVQEAINQPAIWEKRKAKIKN